MTPAALKICRDCTRIAVSGSPYCESHQTDNRALRNSRDRNRNRRETGLKRLYDSVAWRKQTVPFILARDPLCQLSLVCNGQAASTDVDHAIRAEIYVAQHDGDLQTFFNPENLRGACHACHSRKTMLEEHGLWKEPTKGGEGGINL